METKKTTRMLSCAALLSVACAHSRPSDGASPKNQDQESLYLDSYSGLPLEIQGYEVTEEVMRMDAVLRKYPRAARNGWARLPQEVVEEFFHLPLREQIEAAALEGRIERPLSTRWAALLARAPKKDVADALSGLFGEQAVPKFTVALVHAMIKLADVKGLCITNELAAAARRSTVALPAMWHPGIDEDVQFALDAPPCR